MPLSRAALRLSTLHDRAPAQVPVERDLPLRGKPFLGGFRHKQTGLEYHHASVQSLPPPKVHDPNAPEPTARFHRDTQTAVVVTRSQQAVREQGTQMTKLGVSVLDDRHPPSLAAASVGSGGAGADGQGDRYLVPMPYFSADDYDLLKLEKAIDIQRYTRGFFARCRAAELIALAARREEELRQAEEARRAEAEAIHRREVERRMNPRTCVRFVAPPCGFASCCRAHLLLRCACYFALRSAARRPATCRALTTRSPTLPAHTRRYDDFETLFNELEAWRLSETAKINDPANDMEPHERSAALAQLLLREQKLLQTIDRLRGQAAEVNRDRKVRGALSRMAAPKRWQLSDGELVEVSMHARRAPRRVPFQRMQRSLGPCAAPCASTHTSGNRARAQVHTPYTTRAKELYELYNGLRLPLLSVDERLDVLLHVSAPELRPRPLFSSWRVHAVQLCRMGSLRAPGRSFEPLCTGNFGQERVVHSSRRRLPLALPASDCPHANSPRRSSQVKWTVKEFDCNLTRDIVELIDREADMLNRGRSEASLEGLRKRLGNLFLQFVHTPEFNPEAARFQQVRAAKGRGCVGLGPGHSPDFLRTEPALTCIAAFAISLLHVSTDDSCAAMLCVMPLTLLYSQVPLELTTLQAATGGSGIAT